MWKEEEIMSLKAEVGGPNSRKQRDEPVFKNISSCWQFLSDGEEPLPGGRSDARACGRVHLLLQTPLPGLAAPCPACSWLRPLWLPTDNAGSSSCRSWSKAPLLQNPRTALAGGFLANVRERRLREVAGGFPRPAEQGRLCRRQ